MPVKAVCPGCGAFFHLADQFLGKKVRCKRCQQTFLVGGETARVMAQPPPLPVARAVIQDEGSDREAGGTSPLVWVVAGVVACLFLLGTAGGVIAWLVLRPVEKSGRAPVASASPVAIASSEPRVADTPNVPSPAKPEPKPVEEKGEDPAPAVAAPVSAVRGQLPPQLLRELKEATAFIKVDAGRLSASGSGFLARLEGDTGYVITNHHVVNPEAELMVVGRGTRMPPRFVKFAPRNVSVSAVFRSGTAEEKSLPAEVLATDESRDLAVLKVAGAGGLGKPIDLTKKAELVETMPIYILGFPFGKALSMKKGNPAITINRGSVSSLRENDFGQMKAVQIDGALNPGNSGGPVVDEQGRLVGIAVATIEGAGIGLAIAPDELDRMFQGRVGSVATRTDKADKETAEVTVEMKLIDPLNQIRAAFIFYDVGTGAAPLLPQNPDGSFNKMSGGNKVDLRIDNQVASATFTVAFGGKRLPSLIFQPGYVDAKGTTHYTQLSSHRLSRTPPTTPR